jgi:hypothetical protein
MTISDQGRYNGNGYVQVDRFTKAVQVITTDHSKIHDKQGFTTSGLIGGIPNNSSGNYCFKTPAASTGKWIHLKYSEFWGNGQKMSVALYENPTNPPTGGTDIAAVNRNRTEPLAVTSMQYLKKNMTINTAGAYILENWYFGYAVGSRTLDLEFLLKPDTWYIRQITNYTGGTVDTSYFEFWYEED